MSKKILFFIVLSVCIIAPLNNDFFLSGLPGLGQFFHVHYTGMVISMGLLGAACAQPFYGPASDHYGRKPLLLIGLGIFLLASLLVIFASSYTWLLVGRFFQGMGATAAIVMPIAIIRDRYDHDKIIKMMAVLMTIIGVCPAIGPLFGSFLTSRWDWHATFIAILIVGVLFTIFISIFFEETNIHRTSEKISVNKIISNYKQLITQRDFLFFSLTSALSYGVLFSYINVSTLFIMQQLHYSKIIYGWTIAINAVAIVTTAIIAPRIAKLLSLERTILSGTSIIVLGGLLMFVWNEFFSSSILTFVIPIFISTIGVGMIRPTASGGAMKSVSRTVAGSAAAAFSFISFAGSAVLVVISERLVNHMYEFGIFIIITGLGAFFFAHRNHKHQQWQLKQA